MAKIKVKEMKCPCCGAALSLKDQGYGETKCTYCNAIVFISREDTNDGNITVYNKQDNKPIAYINIPLNWDVTNTFVNYNKSTIGIPYALGFDLENTLGDLIHVETGNSFAINGPVSWVDRQTPHTIQKDFIPVRNFLAEFMKDFSRNTKTNFKFLESLDIPIDDYDPEKDFENTRKYYQEYIDYQGRGMFSIVGLYCESACCAYEMKDKIVVAYSRVYGCKYKLNSMPNLGGFGNLLGGLFGGNQQAQQTGPEENDSKYMFGNLNHPGQGENLEWETGPVFLLLTTKDNYKKLYKKAFKQICNSFCISREVENEYNQIKMQYNQEANGMFQQQAQAQYQNGQNLINLGAQRMAANQSYVDSMMARSNRQYEQQRSSYNSRMAAQDRMRDKRTEAILGVNTYIKPDGKEVEVPVSADTAWINGKGEIIGGSAGFNPGSGWTQLDKKY